MNDNQNAFVTRATSRVLAAPGGKSSTGFLFSPKNAPAAPTENNAARGRSTERKEASGMTAVAAAPRSPAAPAAKESAVEAAARIKQKNEAQHFSLFVASPKKAPRPARMEESAATATARIRKKDQAQHVSLSKVPPGGHSSLKLG